MQDSVQTILNFCFNETQPRQWAQVNIAFDLEVKERFTLLHKMAEEGLCNTWTETPEGALAYVMLTSVIPHFLYRDTHKAYALYDQALAASLAAIDKGYDQAFSAAKKKYFYLALAQSNQVENIMVAEHRIATIKNEEPVAYQQALRARMQMAEFAAYVEPSSKAQNKQRVLETVAKI